MSDTGATSAMAYCAACDQWRRCRDGLCESCRDTAKLAEQKDEIARLRAEADEWAMRADGVVHTPHCTEALPCLRCRAEQAERERDEARALLRDISREALLFGIPLTGQTKACLDAVLGEGR